MKLSEKIIYQLGYIRLYELQREANGGEVQVRLPGLRDAYHDYLIEINNEKATLMIEDEYGRVAKVTELEL